MVTCCALIRFDRSRECGGVLYACTKVYHFAFRQGHNKRCITVSGAAILMCRVPFRLQGASREQEAICYKLTCDALCTPEYVRDW